MAIKESSISIIKIIRILKSIGNAFATIEFNDTGVKLVVRIPYTKIPRDIWERDIKEKTREHKFINTCMPGKRVH